MSTIYGLKGTEGFANNRFKSIRRKVFYFYPNGAMPLLGLLSMLNEEQANDPEFAINETRMPEMSSLTAASSNIVFHDGGTAGSTTPGSIFATNKGVALGVNVCIRVADKDKFRAGQVVEMSGIPVAAGGTHRGVFHIVDTPFTDSSVDYIRVTPIVAVPVMDYDGFTTELTVLPIGNAHAQGAVGSSKPAYTLPIKVWNYLQIFRTSFTITGSALKTSLDFDKTGAYRDMARDARVKHFTEMEFGFLFGQRSKSVDTTTNLPTYTTGGVLWFLEEYEKGTTYGNTAPSTDEDDGKRIIENANGVITRKAFENYLERAFRYTSANQNEKLAVCGNGALLTINRLLSGSHTLQSDKLDTGETGMDIVTLTTPFGKVHFKTHPLFTLQPTLRYNMMILDVADMRYRYMEGRDTKLLKNRQPNNADYREDEWLGECGLELRQPEANMYIKNLITHSI